MRSRPHIAVAATLAFGLIAPLAATGAQQEGQQAAAIGGRVGGFSATVEMVRVPVVVMDDDGRFIQGLHQADFEVDDETMQAFESYLDEKDIHVVDAETAPEGTKDDRYFTREEVDAEREWMRNLLKARIASRMFDPGAWYPVRHEYDVTLREAMHLWNSAEELLALNH